MKIYKRRTFIRGGILLFSGIAVWLFREKLGFFSLCRIRNKKIFGVCPEIFTSKSAIGIGKAYRVVVEKSDKLSAETKMFESKLVAELLSEKPEAIKLKLSEQIEADFVSGNTVTIDSWTISKTEALLFASAQGESR